MDPNQQKELWSLLMEFETIFSEKLGKWPDFKENLDLNIKVKPYHAKPYQVPHSIQETFKKELDRPCDIGVLAKTGDSKWAAPCFCNSEEGWSHSINNRLPSAKPSDTA